MRSLNVLDHQKRITSTLTCLTALTLFGACAPVSDAEPSDTMAQAAASPSAEGACQVKGAVDFVKSLGCRADFDALASVPLDANIPGARSAKVVLDMLDGDALYFQNSQKYQIHYQFVSKFLSGNGKPRRSPSPCGRAGRGTNRSCCRSTSLSLSFEMRFHPEA